MSFADKHWCCFISGAYKVLLQTGEFRLHSVCLWSFCSPVMSTKFQTLLRAAGKLPPHGTVVGGQAPLVHQDGQTPETQCKGTGRLHRSPETPNTILISSKRVGIWPRQEHITCLERGQKDCFHKLPAPSSGHIQEQGH